MKTTGYTFYAEMPDEWLASKSGCKTHRPFTRQFLKEWAACGIRCNVIAVFGRGHEPRLREALVPTFPHTNSDVSVGSVDVDHLRRRTVRDRRRDRTEAAPRLAARIEAEG